MFEMFPISLKNNNYNRFVPSTIFDRKFYNSFGTEIKEYDDKYVIETEMPGFDKNELDVSVSNNVLTIKAEHKDAKKETEGERVIYSQREYSSYSKSYTLENIDLNNIKSTYQNGVLIVNLPKKEVEDNKIQIQVD